MTIYGLTKRTETGYSFALKLPPFGIHGFWYDTKLDYVQAPRIMTSKGLVDLVYGAGNSFERLRDIVRNMVLTGKTKHNTDTQADPSALFIKSDLK